MKFEHKNASHRNFGILWKLRKGAQRGDKRHKLNGEKGKKCNEAKELCLIEQCKEVEQNQERS